MRTGRPLVNALGSTSAATCALAAFCYATSDLDVPPVGAWLATLAVLGAAAVAAVTLWQARTSGGARTMVLILLSALAATYVAASVLALVASAEGIRGVPRGAHVVGTVSGSALYIVTLVEVSVSLFTARREGSGSLPAL